MLIGLFIGTMAIQASLKGPATVALAGPLALLAIPIFDTSAAILRRKLRGRSVFSTIAAICITNCCAVACPTRRRFHCRPAVPARECGRARRPISQE